MYAPSVFDTVRVRGRHGEFIVTRVDHAASLVDLCSIRGGTAIERGIDVNLLSESAAFEPEQFGALVGDRLDAATGILQSSWINLRVSRLAIAELRDVMHSTFKVIQATQQRILESDRLIARTQCSYPPPAANEIGLTVISFECAQRIAEWNALWL